MGLDAVQMQQFDELIDLFEPEYLKVLVEMNLPDSYMHRAAFLESLVMVERQDPLIDVSTVKLAVDNYYTAFQAEYTGDLKVEVRLLAKKIAEHAG